MLKDIQFPSIVNAFSNVPLHHKILYTYTTLHNNQSITIENYYKKQIRLPLHLAYSHFYYDDIVTHAHDYAIVDSLIRFNEPLKRTIYEFGIKQTVTVHFIVDNT